MKQMSLDSFYPTKSKNERSSLGTKENRKFRLALSRPSTSPLGCSPAAPSNLITIKAELSEDDVIDISSDNDDAPGLDGSNLIGSVLNSSQTSVGSESAASDSSQTTIIYSISTSSTVTTPHTPTRTPPTYISTNSRSPASKIKFFSPSKNRTVVKRTPVKRKLDQEFSKTHSFVNEAYLKACEGLDDKTVALISIINKYLNNESLCRLLSEESQRLIQKCMHVVKPGMRLVCRLYWRKDGWFKADQLKSIAGDGSQISDPVFYEMLTSLVECGLVVQARVNAQDKGKNNLSFDDLTSILKVEDLKQICKDLKLKSQSKQNAVEALRSYSQQTSIANYFTGSSNNNHSRVLNIMFQRAGPCYRLSDLARRTLYNLYVLMYLGIDYTTIREKKLELTIIHDKIKRETFPVDKDMPLDDASIVFGNKEQFDRYMTAHIIYEDFIETDDLEAKCKIVKQVFELYNAMSESEWLRCKSLPLWLRRFTALNLYVKLLDEGINILKKYKSVDYYSQCIDILTTLILQIVFSQHKKAEWYSEKAFIWYILKEYDRAAEVLLEGFQLNIPEYAKDHMRPRVMKIAKKASEHLMTELMQYAHKENTLEKELRSVTVYKQPMDRIHQYEKLKFERRTSFGREVHGAEDYCILEYIKKGEFTHGYHWEGRMVTTMFFLLFWDIIYMKPPGIAGIFLTHYQKYPLDMFYESFYINRKTLIDDMLDKIERGTTDDILNAMSHTWNSRDECELSGINRSVEWDNVSEVCRCLGPTHTAAICRRLATDYRYASSGFPDLTLWNIHTRKIRFVEVKTDTDKPSVKQIQWMHYLRQNGIDTEFCYLGVHNTKKKSRASES